jgi:glutamate/tyrosine decarboxylase-like PLP-dependent enzyme
MRYLGLDGYTEMMRGVMATTAKVRSAIDALPSVEIIGEPIGPVLSMHSKELDLYAVGDVMDEKGWNLNRNTEPRSLHLMLSPAHADVVDELIADLTDAVANHGESKGVEARYS